MTGLTCSVWSATVCNTDTYHQSEAGKRLTTEGNQSLGGRIFTFDPDKERQEEENAWEM